MSGRARKLRVGTADAVAPAVAWASAVLVWGVDGGIDVQTAPGIVAAGADVLVAGNAIFGSSDPERAIRELRAAAMSAVAS